MNALKKYMGSSIGRKQMMGATGIVLYGYLLVHLVGNIGMLFGAERYNKYGYLLLHEMAELIIPIEIGLIVAILIHIRLAIGLTLENRAARPVAYAVKKSANATLHSASMAMTGTAILIFVVIHIANFRYGSAGLGGMQTVTYDGVAMKDLYGTMMRAFAQWWYTAGYILALILIFSHLAHGVQSSAQSLGFNHPKYAPLVRLAGLAYALLISGGFILLAVWAYFQHGGTP
ncbi:MAG: succinate dehydrogenase cytochrome b subunit [Fibrobacteria bacterium]